MNEGIARGPVPKRSRPYLICGAFLCREWEAVWNDVHKKARLALNCPPVIHLPAS